MWLTQLNNTYFKLKDTSNHLAMKLDRYIEKLFNEITPTLNKNSAATIQCKKDLLPELKNIILNHPQISGITLWNKAQKYFCSTLDNNQSFLFKKGIQGSKMIGPIKIPFLEQPIYALSSETNEYAVEIILMRSMLFDLLNQEGLTAQSIILHNRFSDKNILEIHRETDMNQQEYISNLQLFWKPAELFATSTLTRATNVRIVVTAAPQKIIERLVFYQILLILDVFLISLLLLSLVNGLFEKYSSLPYLLKQAMKRKQFYAMYQPIFDAKINKYIGAEVLLRWRNHLNQIIMPDFFIKEAERTWVIVPITLLIMEMSFKDLHLLFQKNRALYLSFNICPIHFLDDHFFIHFYKLLEEYSIAPNQIVLEITERNLLDNQNEKYLTRMRELRSKGISLAVDDYGTGHSSLSYLQHFPFNYLKIDKLFIHAIGTKAITESLNTAIIDLAKKIKLTVIAEGVETQEQASYLTLNGIHLLQGWYFSKAISSHRLKIVLDGGKNE
ncbi:MAG: hypothetical protein BGO90_01785 [Legionella sp. 40-6]|nr:MAG: hypothetical protein BGO90_01785 [Legionella sp. 40-6]